MCPGFTVSTLTIRCSWIHCCPGRTHPLQDCVPEGYITGSVSVWPTVRAMYPDLLQGQHRCYFIGDMAGHAPIIPVAANQVPVSDTFPFSRRRGP